MSKAMQHIENDWLADLISPKVKKIMEGKETVGRQLSFGFIEPELKNKKGMRFMVG